MEVAALVIGVLGVAFGVYCGWRVRVWERELMQTRVLFAYKGKVKMDPRLVDVLQWSRMLRRDRQHRGQAFYKLGGTTVAVARALPRQATTTTKTVKS